MKILFISAQYPPETKGGGELSTHLIAQGLQALGHDVIVVTDGEKVGERIVDGITVRVAPMFLRQKPLFERAQSIAGYRALKRHVRDLRTFDIIHAHDFRSALVLSHLQSAKAVVTARDYAQISGCTNNIQYNGNIDPGCHGLHELWQCHRVHEADWARKPFRIWQFMYNKGFRKKAFADFKHQIFISNAQKELIAKYQSISHQHTQVIYNPIAQSYLDEPIIEGGAGNVLYTGRVEMYKGVLVLLQAWKKIVERHANVHLLIVGNGAQQKEYEHTAREYGLVQNTSFLSHVPYERLLPIIDNAQIVVAPHIWIEPFGRNVLEAMSRGKIVVASNVGGPAEIITDKETGLLFERGSVDDLAKVLHTALTMSQESTRKMGLQAQQAVRVKFTQEVIAKQHERFYGEIVEGRR